MAKVPGTEETLELLVHSKTYPAASGDFFQAVSTGGVQPNGDFVRLHPVPIRFADMSQEIRRWSLIRVRAYRDDEDNRPESWRLDPQAEVQPFSHFAAGRLAVGLDEKNGPRKLHRDGCQGTFQRLRAN